jgi:hypothetical protein
MDDRTSRIPCTQAGTEGCPGLFPFENVEWLLGEKEADVFLALLAEESIAIKVSSPARIIYYVGIQWDFPPARVLAKNAL